MDDLPPGGSATLRVVRGTVDLDGCMGESVVGSAISAWWGSVKAPGHLVLAPTSTRSATAASVAALLKCPKVAYSIDDQPRSWKFSSLGSF